MLRNGLRVTVAALFAALAAGIWYLFHWSNLHLEEQRHDILGTATLVVAAIFAIGGALFMQGVYERFKRMSHCVLTKNRDEFMLIRDERMPYAIYIVLIMNGLFVLILLGAAEYRSVWTGGLIVFSAACSIAFYLIVIWDMEDVSNSNWFKQRIPSDWWDQTIDQYFHIEVHEPHTRAGAGVKHPGSSSPPPAAATPAPSAASPSTPAAS